MIARSSSVGQRFCTNQVLEMLSKLSTYPARPLPPAQCRASAVKWGFLLKQEHDLATGTTQGIGAQCRVCSALQSKGKGSLADSAL